VVWCLIFFPFMIVIVLDELFFFFHHNLHYFGFFGSVVVSFLDFFSVVSLFRVSFIERAG